MEELCTVMKTTIINLTITSIILAGTIFTGCQSEVEREISVRNTVLEANEELQDWENDTREDAEKKAKEAEWKRFKNDVELTIKNNEFRITALRVKLNKPGISRDPHYATKIKKLEQQNKALERRIKDYREDQDDWESFKSDFNRDLDELGKELRELLVGDQG